MITLLSYIMIHLQPTSFELCHFSILASTTFPILSYLFVNMNIIYFRAFSAFEKHRKLSWRLICTITVLRLQYFVELWSTISKEAPCQTGCTVFLGINSGRNDRNWIPILHASFRHLGTRLICDEGSSVKGDALLFCSAIFCKQDFCSVSVAGDNRNHLCVRMKVDGEL